MPYCRHIDDLLDATFSSLRKFSKSACRINFARDDAGPSGSSLIKKIISQKIVSAPPNYVVDRIFAYAFHHP